MAKAAVLYACTECGYSSPRWFGKCPGCGSFGTLAEERPELRTIIVTNPSTDRDTCAWIREQGDPQVAAVCQKWDDVTEGRFSARGG